jgi:hypothetical protein
VAENAEEAESVQLGDKECGRPATELSAGLLGPATRMVPFPEKGWLYSRLKLSLCFEMGCIATLEARAFTVFGATFGPLDPVHFSRSV